MLDFGHSHIVLMVRPASLGGGLGLEHLSFRLSLCFRVLDGASLADQVYGSAVFRSLGVAYRHQNLFVAADGISSGAGLGGCTAHPD